MIGPQGIHLIQLDDTMGPQGIHLIRLDDTMDPLGHPSNDMVPPKHPSDSIGLYDGLLGHPSDLIG